MKISDLIEQRLGRLRSVLRTMKRALDTERTYCGHVRRFLMFAAAQPDAVQTGAVKLVQRFISAHAEGWAASTQEQVKDALRFYYRHALESPLGDLGETMVAKRGDHLPVWLPHDDMIALLSHLRGTPRLMGELDYGSGLRSQELARLRVHQLDFTAKTITVRSGKGNKDRVTFLPESCIEPLKRHLETMRALWQADRAAGKNAVEVPSSKFNGEDWQWFWVFAANSESADPRTGSVRRHHLHKSTLGKAIRAAVKRSGGNQRVTVHSLRHSFATTLLERGVGIHRVKELLGHTCISTTEIYLHVLPRAAVATLTSPMDAPLANVVAFPSLRFPPPPSIAGLAAL